MKKAFLLILLTVAIAACTPENNSETKLCQYVNPFIGTAYTGHTFPGATCPFGFMQPGPQTGRYAWQYCSGYYYRDSIMEGFSQNRLNGTGCPDLGDILLMPFSGTPKPGYKSLFSKDSEKASPGYYAVHLSDNSVDVEITCTPHVAFHRYRFEKDNPGLYIDFQNGITGPEDALHTHVTDADVNFQNNKTLAGHLKLSNWVNRQLFFVIAFDKPVTDKRQIAGNQKDKAPQYVLSYDLGTSKELNVKIAFSTVSIDGAMQNLKKEINHWKFDRVKFEVENRWEKLLSRVIIEGSGDEKINFYTSMYHLLIQPNNIADTDGRYRGADDEVYQSGSGTYYSTLSLWDTYRAAHPLYTIIAPDYVAGMINSMLAHSQVQGFLPIWVLWGKENYCMIGNHAVPIIVDACLKDFMGINQEEAYHQIKKSLTENHPNSEWDVYNQYGYFPYDLVKTESVSKTLEFSFDDYCAALLAKKLNKTADYQFFLNRSNFYKNLFDSQTKLMRGKNSKGQWRTPFGKLALSHASSIGGDYTEGNAWQYTWQVQHDMIGLMDLMGGKDAFITRLDSLFSIESTIEGEGFVSDVTGLIGQYAHGNEPCHHVAYFYSLAGKNWKTEELVRRIFDTFYQPRPDGLCGNDDCGQMSAWYIFSTLGFYPVNPVSGEYVFGAPQIPKATIKLPYNKEFTMIAKNLSKENKYVKLVKLNGVEIQNSVITHSQIINGGVLEFEMTNEPLAVILDTDMGNDIDDAMALDMLYKYMDAGKINLLGIVLNKDYRYSPEFIDIMAAWYGYPDVPVAALKKGKTLSIDDSNYTKTVSELKSNGKPLFERSAKNYNSLPQPVQLYRKLLAGQPDSSVTVISIGFLTNLAALLESGADEFSPLNGKELVSRKVKLLSVMAGSFTSNPYAEYNIVQDISSAKKVFSVCPVPVIVSPFEVGDSIRYPGVSIERDFKWATKHPLVEAYKAYMPNTSYDRSTWDLTLVLYVASGQDQTFFDRSRPGLISVDDKGCTHFVEKTDGRHAFLTVSPRQRDSIQNYFLYIIPQEPAKYKKE